jgi:hypothetical protein
MNVIKFLNADGPDPALKDKLMLFGQLVGDWEYESERYFPTGYVSKRTGEIHFGWILNGTAIQDVWIARVENPLPGIPATSFGTTIRFYDPKIDAWRITWITPVGSLIQSFVARAVGDEIILEGKTPDGTRPERWVISEITPQSCRWRSEEFNDDEKTWRLIHKLAARRVGPG